MPEENTSTFTKSEVTTNLPPDSAIAGVSVRAWLVIMLAGTVCFTHCSVVLGVLIDAIFFAKDWGKVGTYTNISEPLYGLAMIAVGFFFGQKTNK